LAFTSSQNVYCIPAKFLTSYSWNYFVVGSVAFAKSGGSGSGFQNLQLKKRYKENKILSGLVGYPAGYQIQYLVIKKSQKLGSGQGII